MTLTIHKQKNGYSLSAEEMVDYNTKLTSGIYVTETEDTLLEKIRSAMTEVVEKTRIHEEEKAKKNRT